MWVMRRAARWQRSSGARQPSPSPSSGLEQAPGRRQDRRQRVAQIVRDDGEHVVAHAHGGARFVVQVRVVDGERDAMAELLRDARDRRAVAAGERHQRDGADRAVARRAAARRGRRATPRAPHVRVVGDVDAAVAVARRPTARRRTAAPVRNTRVTSESPATANAGLIVERDASFSRSGTAPMRRRWLDRPRRDRRCSSRRAAAARAARRWPGARRSTAAARAAPRWRGRGRRAVAAPPRLRPAPRSARRRRVRCS